MFKLGHFRLILWATLVLIVTLVFDVLTRTPDVPPANVVLANLTDQSATLTWTTPLATRGSVAISTQPNRVLRTLEFFVGAYGNTPVRFFADEIAGTTHYVFLSNLTADTAYYYRIYSGGRWWKEASDGQILPSLKTAKVLDTPSLPNPVFGRVVDQNQVPAAQTLVTLFLVSASNPNLIMSKTLAAYTDSQGLWQTDLGNLRSFDGTAAVTANNQDMVFVTVYAPTGQTQAIFLPFNNTKNLGEIILR